MEQITQDHLDQSAGSKYRSGSRLAEEVAPIISQLRTTITGRVIAPDDEGYDAGRTLFYGGYERHPAVIVRAADVDDVARVVNLARASGLPLAVRGGGHSAAGHSVCDDGIVLDLRDLRSLEIDVENHAAWAGAGLTAGEFTKAVTEHNLVTGFGDTGSVGIGGITLGGGVGYLVRKHGLTIDSLLAAEMVTADGRVLYVDVENHPDLFWAIRGGGGNFGVVTRFHYRLHPLDSFAGGMLILPATPGVIAGFIAAAEAAPDELSTIANVMPAPPMPFLPPEAHGKMIVFALMAYSGPAESADGVFAPFRALATPLADMLRPMRYAEMFPPEEGDYHPTAAARTMFINTINLDEARTILDFLQSSDAVMRGAQLRVLGGAMGRVPVNATAFAHRRAPIMVNLANFYHGPEDRIKREAWVEKFAAALKQNEDGTYVNFLGEEGVTRLNDAYPGATLERLMEIKARYDPANLFRLNHNIPPKETSLS